MARPHGAFAVAVRDRATVPAASQEVDRVASSRHPRDVFFPDDGEVTVKISLPQLREDRVEKVPTLKVVAGPGRDMLRFWTLGADDRLVIGRDEREAGVVLSDVTVSKRHASLSTDRSGAVWVVDLGSTNGTAVNGLRIDRPVALHAGDDLEIGGVLMRLELLSADELAHLDRVKHRLAEAGSDPLTCLRTRRYLAEELPELLQRSRLAGLPVCCLFMDLDRFKSINDSYGHHVGDEVLARTSRIILGDVREDDVGVRYGGEELVLFLPSTALQAGLGAAERLRRKIADHDWYRTAPDLRVTVSIGVAELRPDETVEAWVRRADAAMYRAKATGKNRVCAAS